MSLINKTASRGPGDSNTLTQQEIEFLLALIRQSTFQGESLESLYNLVLKLQQQYLSLGK